ncbi:MAG TPA: endonuclease III [Leptolyngbyaceae cyanobacterium]
MALAQPFNIDLAVERVREAVRPYPKAAMFQLAEEGFDSLFEQLIACIISIRTYDEVSVSVARRLLGRARTPQAMLELGISDVLNTIRESTFADRKAEQIIAIAQQIVSNYNGNLPADPKVLTEFNGVGPKCSHLALGVACGLPYISVDVHVHRVTNRWGYVHTSTPEKTMLALQKQLPEKYWVEINALLVPFGKHICRGTKPRCGHCPVEAMCAQVGVTEAVG